MYSSFIAKLNIADTVWCTFLTWWTEYSLSIGSYVKWLNPLDNDLPIVNKAVVDYFIKGIDPEETIFDCDRLIDFQKVVKISKKYDYAQYKDEIMTE